MTRFRLRLPHVSVATTAIAATLAFYSVQPPTPVAAGTYTTFDLTLGGINDLYGSATVSSRWDSAAGGVRSYLYDIYDTSAYTTIHATGSTSTYAQSLFGKRVAGYYRDAAGKSHGFLYESGSYTTLDVGTSGTWATSVSADRVVGYYKGSGSNQYHGFVYDGSTYTMLDPVGSTSSQASSISGNNIVGSYRDTAGRNYGYLYNGSTYTTLNYPGEGTWSWAVAVSGGNVAGQAFDVYGPMYSFLYDGSHYWQIGDSSGGEADLGTRATDVYGSTVVGYYNVGLPYDRAFVWDSGTMTFLNVPGSGGNTHANAIWGNVVVGDYYDTTTHTTRGFIYTIPEPSTLALLCVAAALSLSRFMAYRRRHARPQQP
jgi:hypothetical protein